MDDQEPELFMDVAGFYLNPARLSPMPGYSIEDIANQKCPVRLFSKGKALTPQDELPNWVLRKLARSCPTDKAQNRPSSAKE